MIVWVLFGAGWCSGFTVAWGIWFFAPYLAARRRDRELEHRLHHRRPHPNGGTWPYALPLCDCNLYPNDPSALIDGPECAG